MAEPVLTQYAVPVGQAIPPVYLPPQAAPRAAQARPPEGGSTTAVLLVVVLLFVLLIVYYTWRRRYQAKPNCKSYGEGTSAACAALEQACGSNGSCLNAVAHCMPVLDSLSAANGDSEDALKALNGPQLRACTNAIADVNPRYAAHMIAQMGGAAACVPAAYQDPASYDAMLKVARAVEPLLPWSVEVARAMPTCPAPPSQFSGREAPQFAGHPHFAPPH